MTDNLESALEQAIQRHLGPGHRLAACQRLSAGASAETYAIDVDTEGRLDPLILRRSATRGGFGVSVDKRTEALVQQAAVQNAVPAPTVRFILDAEDNLGEGYVMQRGEGETLPKRILEKPEYATARAALVAQCAHALASIHAVPGDQLPDLPAMPAPAQLQQIETLYRNAPLVSPVFELAFRWLEKRLPPEQNLTLVHGDFRNGNLLVDGQGLQLVLDWELTHLGDPMEDLGWLCVNAWRFGQRDKPVGGLGDRNELYTVYEAATGMPVDPERVRFWEMFGCLKWGVICVMQAMFHLSGAIRSVERAAIGRRVSEVELDLMDLIEDRCP